MIGNDGVGRSVDTTEFDDMKTSSGARVPLAADVT
jgi:hypothetical protein